MKDFTELLNLIEISLLEHKYDDFDTGSIENLNLLRVFKTKRKLGVRMLCVVAELPDNISSVSDFSNYYHLLRNSLTKKYAKFPYWKELGTYSILLCENEKYDILKTEIKDFKDKTGLHMNVMLGTILINKDKLEFSDCATWGLFMTGKHFTTIKDTITEWIKNKKIDTK